MDEEKIVSTSMEMIIQSGDARLNVIEALTAIAENDFECAEVKLKQAQGKISMAHAAHTDMIQGEARGEAIGYSLLFTHAQDTMMTINSELILAKQLYKMYQALDKRIANLEKNA